MDGDTRHLAAALHEITALYEGSTSYSQAHAAAVAGRFPAEREGGRIKVRRIDYPVVAKALGLKPRRQVA